TEQQIQQLTSQRDALVQRMKDVLNASFGGHEYSGHRSSEDHGQGEQLIREGRHLLEAANTLAGL
ncbi:MAG: hypothetical protein ACREMY_33345, partial [bacterium]